MRRRSLDHPARPLAASLVALAALAGPAAGSAFAAEPPAFVAGDAAPRRSTPATNSAGTAIPVGAGAQAVAITPDGKTAYVVGSGADTSRRSTSPTNTAGTRDPRRRQPAGHRDHARRQDRLRHQRDHGDVTPIDTATTRRARRSPSAPNARGIAITPDGKTAYVDARRRPSRRSTSPTTRAGTPIPVGANPHGHRDHARRQDRLRDQRRRRRRHPDRRSQRRAGAAIPVGDDPQAIAITPDGKTAYVANAGGDTRHAIATATNAAGTAIPVGDNPQGIAVTRPARPRTSPTPAERGHARSTRRATPPGTAITVGGQPARHRDHARPGAGREVHGQDRPPPARRPRSTPPPRPSASARSRRYAWSFGDGTRDDDHDPDGQPRVRQGRAATRRR